jgi:hypothetical protein
VKLYVSVLPCALPEAVPVVARWLAERAPDAPWKVGAALETLCRPDKLVVYLPDEASARATGTALAGALRGLPAQGVPFTSALDEDGLCSWGADPPRVRDAWAPAGSWRAHLTGLLGRGMAQAQAAGADDVVGHALDRVRLAGVDVSAWTPPPDLWGEA